MERDTIHGDPVGTDSTCDMASTLRQSAQGRGPRSFTRDSAQHHGNVTDAAYGDAVPDIAAAPAHQVTLSRNARFMLPTCTCGWIGTARLTEAAAREEARDHALLYAPDELSPDELREWITAVSWSDDDAYEIADADPDA